MRLSGYFANNQANTSGKEKKTDKGKTSGLIMVRF